jgi:hypothetical protein
MELVTVDVGTPSRHHDGHLCVDFELLVREAEGVERRIPMTARGVGLGWLARSSLPPQRGLYGITEGVELAERPARPPT